MPVYEYKGLNKKGRNIRSTIDADNMRVARTKLKKQGVYVVEIKDKSKTKKKAKSKVANNKSVGIKDISLMTRQLATLLRANIPLVESIGACADQMENPILKDALYDCKNMVNEGSTFHKALRKYPKMFDTIFVSMCEAGETSGTLDTILIRLAEFKEAQNELQSKITSALAYPVIMIIFMLGILAVMFLFVVPKMTAIFEDAGMELPWYTQMVIDFSGLLVNYWLFIIAGIGLSAFIFNNWKNSVNGRKTNDAIVLKLPLIGKLARMIAVSRFTRTLSTLLNGGVPMLNAMDIVRNVVNNNTIAKAVDDARDNISEGENIAGPLKRSGQFPPIVIHMVNIGEKTGELENMLEQVSDSYDFQVKNAVAGLTSILEPLLIIVMGGVIAVIVFSMLIPMFEMANFGG